MEVREIQISTIIVEENIRQYEDKNNHELMSSIKNNGLMQPIGVKELPNNQGYRLIWGYRRLNACKKLGWRSIPAVIFLKKDEEMTEEDFFVLNATENLQRKSNNLKEFGRVCKILKRTMSISEIASRLAVPSARVHSALNEIARIPIKWQSKIRIMDGDKEKKGDIPLSTASRIASFKDLNKDQKDDLFNEVSKNDTGFIELCYISNLMKKGYSIEEAKVKIKGYEPLSYKILVKKGLIQKDLDENPEKYPHRIDWFVSALNEKAGDNDFAVKMGDLYGPKLPKSK